MSSEFQEFKMSRFAVFQAVYLDIHRRLAA